MFLTVVGCLDVQNAAFTSQSGEDTNQIGRFEVLDVIWISKAASRHNCRRKAAPRQCSNKFDTALGLHFLCPSKLGKFCSRFAFSLHRHYGQVGGRTAKCLLAFTKLACMIWGISLLLHKFKLH